jgi:hypothetical protein
MGKFEILSLLEITINTWATMTKGTAGEHDADKKIISSPSRPNYTE